MSPLQVEVKCYCHFLARLIAFHLVQWWHWPCPDLPGDTQTALFRILNRACTFGTHPLASLAGCGNEVIAIFVKNTRQSHWTDVICMPEHIHQGKHMHMDFSAVILSPWTSFASKLLSNECGHMVTFYDVFVRRDSTTYVTRILWIGQHASPSFVMFVYLQKYHGHTCFYVGQ